MASTTAASNLLEKTFFGVEKNVKGAQLPLLKAPARNGKKNLTVAMASKKKVRVCQRIGIDVDQFSLFHMSMLQL